MSAPRCKGKQGWRLDLSRQIDQALRAQEARPGLPLAVSVPVWAQVPQEALEGAACALRRRWGRVEVWAGEGVVYAMQWRW